MPVVQISGRLVYFAHVPKCAGTSVGRYLQLRFGPLGFRDARHLLVSARQRWTKSSPQHVDTKSLEHLLPVSFFSASFTIVRHPVERVRSVFLFQRDIEKAVPRDTDFGDWVDALPDRMRRNPFYLDNHTRAMNDLVPEATTVFRLENGLGKVVGWLDELAGSSDGEREIKRTNTYRQNLQDRKLNPGSNLHITAPIRQRIAEVYAADMERFGYLVDEAPATGGVA